MFIVIFGVIRSYLYFLSFYHFGIGIIGDQNAALVGQQCFGIGQAKVTYGTGCFLIQNIGPGPLHDALKTVSPEAKRKLIITVGYKFGVDQPACYALEGSVAIAGAAVTWLRDNLELVGNYSEIEHIARQDATTGGLYFVPALQGLYAPYWDANATGTIIGVSQFSRKCHLVRATLEGVAYQANDVLSMMMTMINDGTGTDIHKGGSIKVDGGMSSNDLLCQFLADISGCRIERPTLTEATSLGAAIVAGYALKLWPEFNSLILNYDVDSIVKYKIPHSQSIEKQAEVPARFDQKFDCFEPSLNKNERLRQIANWRMAVNRSRKWIRVEVQEERKMNYKRLSALPFMLFVMLSFGTHILSVLTSSSPSLSPASSTIIGGVL